MRTGLAAMILLSLTLFAFTSAADAQDSACALSMTEGEDNPSTNELEAQGDARSFTFTISNQGSLDARGSFQVLSTPPPGWFWNTQAQPVTVASGQSMDTSITVDYVEPTDTQAELRVQVQDVQCTQLGIGGEPSQVITLSLSPAPGGETGLTDDAIWPWAIFGVLVLGTAIAIPAYYRRGRVRVEAFCEEPEREVVAGRGTSFPVVLRNKSSEPAHVRLEVTDVSEGWSALTTLPDLELGPKESRTLYMMVRAPEEARPGDLCVTKLTVAPEGGSGEVIETVSRVIKAPGNGNGGNDADS